MKKGILRNGLFMLLVMTIISCTVDRDDEPSILGTWIETAPVPDRTTLVFESQSRVIRIDGEDNAERFNYRIEGRAIILTLPDGGGTSEIFFEQINTNKIKTGDFYPSIPEAEPVFIIFERE